MLIGISTAITAQLRGGVAFTPATLFANGEQGAWFAPSPDTCFTDTAGTSPAGVGDAVALMLDKSQGLELGGEVFSDISGFASEIGGGSLEGPMEFLSVGVGGVTHGSKPAAGKAYSFTISYTKTNSTSEFSVNNSSGSKTNTIAVGTASSGTFEGLYYAKGSVLYLRISDTDTVTINSISFRELPGNHATQDTAAAQPLLQQTAGGEYYLEFDGVDDVINVEIPTGGLTGTLYYASSVGKGAFGVDYAAGTQGFGNVNGATWDKDIYALIAVDRTLTSAEIAQLGAKYSIAGDFDTLTSGQDMFTSNNLTALPTGMTLPALTNGVRMFDENNGLTALPADMTLPALTTAAGMFRNCGLTALPANMTLDALTDGFVMFQNNNLTTLPADMTLPALTNGKAMFQNSNLTALPTGMTLPALKDSSTMFRGNNLTALPAGMTLPALTNSAQMFYDNSTLETVPSDFASDSDCTNWSLAFGLTNLTQQSIDNILTNLDARGTSNGTFDQSGGSAPSATGETAIDNMRGRGWTISVTGGY